MKEYHTGVLEMFIMYTYSNTEKTFYKIQDILRGNTNKPVGNIKF